MGNVGRSERLGILSTKEIELIHRADNRENLTKERDYLLTKESRTDNEEKRLKEINRELREISTRFPVFVKVLYSRIVANEEDWKIILKSRSLRSLATTSSKHFVRFPMPYDGDYDNYGISQSIGDFFAPKFEELDETELIPNYSKWKVRFKFDREKKLRLYWLDTNITPTPTAENIFNPEYSIKGIKGTWKRKTDVIKRENTRIETIIQKIDVRVILKEALDLEKRFQSRIRKGELLRILPRMEENAIDIFAIKDKISKFQEQKQTIDSTVPMVEDDSIQDDTVRSTLQEDISKDNEMVRAHSEIKPDIAIIQKKLEKYGLKLHYSQKSSQDY